MRALLDTHALLWWLAGDRRLSRRARALIGEEANDILVSAVSAWEIASKVRLGKLPGVAEHIEDLPGGIASQGFSAADVTFVQALRAGTLPGPLRDPFDRMLIAQAHDLAVPLVSNERVFDAYGVARIW